MRHSIKTSILMIFFMSSIFVCTTALSAGSLSAGVFGQYRWVNNELFNDTYGNAVTQYGFCLNYRFANHWSARIEGAFSKTDGSMTLKQDPISFHIEIFFSIL